jgi:hypothetical protein
MGIKQHMDGPHCQLASHGNQVSRRFLPSAVPLLHWQHIYKGLVYAPW